MILQSWTYMSPLDEIFESSDGQRGMSDDCCRQFSGNGDIFYERAQV